MKKSVGLLVCVNINNTTYAILQKRGEFNTEKMKTETWPGGCQPTCHGKVEEGEDEMVALDREMSEELGDEFLVMGSISKSALEPLPEFQDESKHVKTWGFLLSDSRLLREIRWHPDSGGMRLLSLEELSEVQDITNYPKDDHVPPNVTAMFPNDLAATRKALEIFG